jgi:dihydroorotate dehydrogenase
MTLKLNIPFKYTKPFFHALDPETAHKITILALKLGLHPQYTPIQDPRLKVDFCGNIFSNPIGVSAGFDKNGEVIEPVLKMGFGFIEAGGVTIPAQDGLPRPRIFRDIKNEAIINKMNFPNKGMENFKNNIVKFYNKINKSKGLLGVQIAMTSGQTKPEKDFKILIENLGAYADYMVFNISCPNTPGLRNLEQKENFTTLAKTLINHRDKHFKKINLPLLAKFSPDLEQEQLEGLAEACLDVGIDGIVLTNTTTTRPDYLPKEFRERQGGLSGRPLTEKSTEVIRQFYKLTKGQIPIIGVGGISSGKDAYDKIKAGASLIQIYSALVYHGPELANQINQDLLTYLDRDGFKSITDAVGSDHKEQKKCA